MARNEADTRAVLIDPRLKAAGSFVLPGDERNPAFSCNGPQGKRGLMLFLLSLVPPSLHPRIAGVSIQRVMAAIKSSERHGWITEFGRKMDWCEFILLTRSSPSNTLDEEVVS
jgi:hypothetical protein